MTLIICLPFFKHFFIHVFVIYFIYIITGGVVNNFLIYISTFFLSNHVIRLIFLYCEHYENIEASFSERHFFMSSTMLHQFGHITLYVLYLGTHGILGCNQK